LYVIELAGGLLTTMTTTENDAGDGLKKARNMTKVFPFLD